MPSRCDQSRSRPSCCTEPSCGCGTCPRSERRLRASRFGAPGPTGHRSAQREGGCDNTAVRRIAVLFVVLIVVAGCTPAENPDRAELLARLAQEGQLSQEEIARVFEQVDQALQHKTIRVVRGATSTALGDAERSVVLGMLGDRAGVFDEGLRSGGGRRARVFNAPGLSNNPEIEATRRLFIDVETFLPLRFEFAYAFPSPDDYALDLMVN